MPTTSLTLPDGREIEVDYFIFPAEPDVGLPHPYCDLNSITLTGSEQQLQLTDEEENWIIEKIDTIINEDEDEDER